MYWICSLLTSFSHDNQSFYLCFSSTTQNNLPFPHTWLKIHQHGSICRGKGHPKCPLCRNLQVHWRADLMRMTLPGPSSNSSCWKPIRKISVRAGKSICSNIKEYLSTSWRNLAQNTLVLPNNYTCQLGRADSLPLQSYPNQEKLKSLVGFSPTKSFIGCRSWTWLH